MIHVLHARATSEQIQGMLQELAPTIKIVVDVRRRTLAGGGSMHSDCETALLDEASEQDDLWGANWFPEEQRIEFESLINIRPRLGNRGIVIQDEGLRRSIEAVTRELLGGVP
jgi:hypothetical protein